KISGTLLLAKLLVGLLAGLLLLPLAPLLAAEELYQGRAVVADQSAAEQAKGTRAALQQVLGKLSGLNSFDAYPGVADALSSASKIVLAFYYENRPVTLPDGSTSEDLLLVANFSPKAVDQIRKDLQLPRWKPERAALTIWPIVDDGLERRIMPIELEYAWLGLADLAIDRGMPLRWPEADENGEYAADVQLLWGGYTDKSSGPASAAAVAGETLVIAALQDGPEWNVRMNLDYEGLLWSERFRGVDLETVLQQGLNLAIDQIVGASSIAATDSGEWQVEITVTQLTNSDDYSRCVAYLQGLSVVESVAVNSVTAGKVHFSLLLNASPDYLQRYIAAGKTLTSSGIEGEYQLLP
ncbi:MAG TPA: DUF2066 domain-containing protein, partial [Xanthomonadales bacterium]|nr:DUF2066 domain-containing protein [Xanthomonadales bacterium]